MSKKKQNDQAHDGLKIKGMFRLQIDDNGEIVGDTGWRENQITNAGFLNIVNQLGTSLTGSKISHAALGTGGAPGATDVTQAGEVVTNGSNSVVRAAVTAATSSTSKTLRNTATFSSSNSFISASANISNIGLWQTSGPISTSGSLLAGNTYTSSALATNQNVNITYDIIFS
jgi:hypothetical protein